MFRMPREHGLTNVRPSHWYRYCYPVSANVLQDIAYRFDTDYIDRPPDLSRAIEQELRPLVAEWQAGYNAGQFTLERQRDGARVRILRRMADEDPGTAEDLNGFVDHALCHFGCEQLGHCCRARDAFVSARLLPGGTVDQETRGVECRRDLPDFFSDDRHLGERLAELTPPSCVRDGFLQRTRRHATRRGAHRRPQSIERAHPELEATIQLTHQRAFRNTTLLQTNPAKRMRGR